MGDGQLLRLEEGNRHSLDPRNFFGIQIRGIVVFLHSQ
jgi:hypothetical protein